jgi:hypothetical protein
MVDGAHQEIRPRPSIFQVRLILRRSKCFQEEDDDAGGAVVQPCTDRLEIAGHRGPGRPFVGLDDRRANPTRCFQGRLTILALLGRRRLVLSTAGGKADEKAEQEV